jgi:hypothetical protein
MSEPFWSVHVYGFEGCPYDPIVSRPTRSAARYAAFKALREAGYYTGRRDFPVFLANVSVRSATATEIEFARRLDCLAASETQRKAAKAGAE